LFKSKEFIAYREAYKKASQGEDFDFPIHLEIENLYACNLHCPHCAREHIEDIAVQTMDIASTKRLS
jgi:MoaA/NifB/PqqE/SkfB family radical SAM enzyme